MVPVRTNSTDTSFSSLLSHTDKAVIVDLGTGDGRFVYRMAQKNPEKFYIGIDANADNLAETSAKAAKKPAKGGAPNALFVQAAIEDLPKELISVADEVHIHFPWGSLLRSVVLGDAALAGIRKLAKDDAYLEAIIGVNHERDKTEHERLGLPTLNDEFFATQLEQVYQRNSFMLEETGTIGSGNWPKLCTSWASKLAQDKQRILYYVIARAV